MPANRPVALSEVTLVGALLLLTAVIIVSSGVSALVAPPPLPVIPFKDVPPHAGRILLATLQIGFGLFGIVAGLGLLSRARWARMPAMWALLMAPLPMILEIGHATLVVERFKAVLPFLGTTDSFMALRWLFVAIAQLLEPLLLITVLAMPRVRTAWSDDRRTPCDRLGSWLQERLPYANSFVLPLVGVLLIVWCARDVLGMAINLIPAGVAGSDVRPEVTDIVMPLILLIPGILLVKRVRGAAAIAIGVLGVFALAGIGAMIATVAPRWHDATMAGGWQLKHLFFIYITLLLAVAKPLVLLVLLVRAGRGKPPVSGYHDPQAPQHRCASMMVTV
jgi:hypothetical protein